MTKPIPEKSSQTLPDSIYDLWMQLSIGVSSDNVGEAVQAASKDATADDKKLLSEFGDCFKAEKVNPATTNAVAADNCIKKASARFAPPATSTDIPASDQEIIPPSKSTGPLEPFKKGEAVARLRTYLFKERKAHDTETLPDDLLQDVVLRFEKYYNEEIKPRTPPSDLADVEKEYAALREFGFTRKTDKFALMGRHENPGRVGAFQLYAGGAGLLKFGLGLFSSARQIFVSKPFTWNIALPVPRAFVNPELTGAEAVPLTPKERKTQAMWNWLDDGAYTLGLLWPLVNRHLPSPSESENPSNAGSKAYTTFGGIKLPNNTWKYLTRNLFGRMEAEATYSISLKSLESATDPITGKPLFDTGLRLAIDVSKLMYLSNKAASVKADIDTTNALAVGDGTQCSADPAAEVDLYKQQHPGTTKSYDEIMHEICAGKPLGSNEALPAFYRSVTHLTWNFHMNAYMATAMGRNFTLSDDKWDKLWLAGAVALAQPLINQAPNMKKGFKSSQLLNDYMLELGAFGATVLSLGKPELRQPYSSVLDLWVQAFTLPEANAAIANFVSRDEPNGLTFPTTSLMDNGFNLFSQYFIGVKIGAMFHKGLATEDVWGKIQYMSPLVLATGAQVARVIRDVQLNQAPYSPKPSFFSNQLFRFLDPVAFAVGTVTGALTHRTRDGIRKPISLGVNGLVGGESKTGVSWGVDLLDGEPKGIQLRGSF